MKETVDLKQPAPPPSPIFPEINEQVGEIRYLNIAQENLHKGNR